MASNAAKLGGLAKALGALASVPAQVARAASNSIAELIAGEFDVGRDPYGEEWTELAPVTLAKGRTPPPLTDTHAMRDSVEVKPMRGAGISITIDDPGAHHQYGYRNAMTGRKVPARPVLPNKGLPGTWVRAIADAADQAYARSMRGYK